LNKIKKKSNKTVGATLNQLFLDVVIRDEENRELEIITPWEGFIILIIIVL
jgi:hypothetical protein